MRPQVPACGSPYTTWPSHFDRLGMTSRGCNQLHQLGLQTPTPWACTCRSSALCRAAGLGADVVQHALAAPGGQLAVLEGLGQPRAGARCWVRQRLTLRKQHRLSPACGIYKGPWGAQ